MENNMKVLDAQLCLTLCDHMDCSPPGSSVHGILQARILEWVATLFSRGTSQPDPGIEPWSLALQADSLPSEKPGKPMENNMKFAQKIKKNNKKHPSELLYYTIIPLVGFYLKKTSSKRYVHHIFTAVLFTIAKILNKLSVHH